MDFSLGLPSTLSPDPFLSEPMSHFMIASYIDRVWFLLAFYFARMPTQYITKSAKSIRNPANGMQADS